MVSKKSPHERIAFGFLGTKLDLVGGLGEKRLRSWRPSVALGSDPHLRLTTQVIWHNAENRKLAAIVKRDLESINGGPTVILHEVDYRDPWDFEEIYGLLYDFASQYPFSPEKAEYFVHLTTGTHVAQICLFLLTESRHFPAKLVQTSPGRAGVPPSSTIIDLDLSQYDRLAQRFAERWESDKTLLKAGIKTKNGAFNALIAEIELVARESREPILLEGPTGAGKSSLARQIYLLKKEHHQISGEFVEINCATIRGEQAMSALFGHAKGAFTGAVAKRDGLLKRAHKGVLFLDEVAELGADEQAMLLRAIEERRFLPVGSDREETSDFLLIAGTNRPLRDGVACGDFREDLLFRINTWCFRLPSLAERREDIEPNLEFELRKYEEMTGKRVTFSAEAKSKYLSFAKASGTPWYGNFRDLNASVKRMATLAPQGRITEKVVSVEIERLQSSWRGRSEHPAEKSGTESIMSANRVLHRYEIDTAQVDPFDQVQLAVVLETLEKSRTIAEAGRSLFPVSRRERDTTNDSDRLRKYLGRFGIDARAIIAGGNGSGE